MAADEGLAHEERREAGDSPTTKVTAAKTSDLAASTRPRFGTAIRLVRIIPEEYSELRPRIIRMVVVFPAPFGPRNPVTTPGRMEKDRSLTAMVEP
jgi:hypothetical protein